MTAPKTTIETVTVVRPLKVCALLCLIVATILIIVALATTTWLKAGGFRTGLFEECTSDNAPTPLPPSHPEPRKCRPVHKVAYIQATAGLLVIAALLTVLSAGLTTAGLRTDNANRKYLFYRVAMYVALVAVLLELISLVVFPVCFYLEMKNLLLPSWDFDWSYGVAWGSALFTFGAALLLICDKEHEEIYYKEKTIYTAAPLKDAQA